MQADFAVELGPDDETLEFPWADDKSGLRYYDLKCDPGLLRHVEEAQREPALAEFLIAMNSASSIFKTAKCDAWASTEINPEEEIFGATRKFGSYVDLVFADEQLQMAFPPHEEFLRQLTALLNKAPEIPAAAEFLIRRCYFQQTEARSGFYITFYLFGFGEGESQARQRWVIGLKLAENAIRQAMR